MDRQQAYSFLEQIAADTTATLDEVNQAQLILAKLDVELKARHPSLVLESRGLIGNRTLSASARQSFYKAIERGFSQEGSLDARISSARNAVFHLKQMFDERLENLQQAPPIPHQPN